ncbi:unannotated protein [freshwater metagenome]|uniref:Unannotated protein n=1 Tax=freshwater metagenome TaxID=449393 RepID=A0A6J7S643_9ZZZZ
MRTAPEARPLDAERPVRIAALEAPNAAAILVVMGRD